LILERIAVSQSFETQEVKPLLIQLMLKEVVKLTHAVLPSNIRIDQDIRSDCRTVLADLTQIHQLIMNLVTNAYHAMQKTGRTLSVSLSEVNTSLDETSIWELHLGEYICLTITDTGSGIKKSILGKIFDPYFPTKGVNKGTGIGLSVAHSIVKNYKGEIFVDGTPGKGFCFTAFFSVYYEKISTGEWKEELDMSIGNERILMVDDEDHVLNIQKVMLKRSGVPDDRCQQSLNALSLFKSCPNDFDLVVTDMTIPDMIGDVFFRAIIDVRQDIPIVICTGFSKEIDENIAQKIGVKDF
jgi:CheY-like chemotaxis protein